MDTPTIFSIAVPLFCETGYCFLLKKKIKKTERKEQEKKRVINEREREILRRECVGRIRKNNYEEEKKEWKITD